MNISRKDLVNIFSESEIDPITDFLISQNFPKNESKEFYGKLLDILVVLQLNMHCADDAIHIDNWIYKTCKELKNQKEWIN
jgi:hypothetical protein